jgi:hypothetical protein
MPKPAPVTTERGGATDMARLRIVVDLSRFGQTIGLAVTGRTSLRWG